MEKIKIFNIEITNPEKIVEGKIKKIDIVNFYNKISSDILPYLNIGYISEIRCQNNFNCFYKKHSLNDSKSLIKIENKSDLIKEVQLNTIEFHLYGNMKNNNLFIMVFDLDPDINLSLKKLRVGVLKLKEVLDKLNLVSFLKTSGGKGYHVLVPFTKIKTTKNFENFSKKIALFLEKTYPNIFTTSIKKTDRKGKIFVDYLRNKVGSTCVSPYSLRARKNFPISFPILWEDLNKITPNKINIKNYHKYLNKNVWKNFFKISQELK